MLQTSHPPLNSESKYIACSIFYLLQLLVLAIPILVIARENTSAYYMVLSLILFLMALGTTLLIFVPKIIAHKNSSGRLSSLMVSANGYYRPAQQKEREGSVAEVRRRAASKRISGSSEIAEDHDEAVNQTKVSGERRSSHLDEGRKSFTIPEESKEYNPDAEEEAKSIQDNEDNE